MTSEITGNLKYWIADDIKELEEVNTYIHTYILRVIIFFKKRFLFTYLLERETEGTNKRSPG